MPEKKVKSKNRTTTSASKSNGKKPLAEEQKAAYFSSLTVENVRCFGSPAQTLYLSDSDGNLKQWTIILGDNGTGKTTLLQSFVAMIPKSIHTDLEGMPAKKAVLPNIWALRNSSHGFLLGLTHFEMDKDFSAKVVVSKKNKHEQSSISAEIAAQASITQTLESTAISLKILDNVGISTTATDSDFIELANNYFAYGALRKAGLASLSEQFIEDNYATLFDDTAMLINAEEWLLRMDYAATRNTEHKEKEKRKRELDLVKQILIAVLPDIEDIRFGEKTESRTPKPIVEFCTPYGWVEGKDLSLGYRTSMAWVVDLASRMFNLYPESENPLEEPAVVLIDEIDLHLHPKWQRDLIDYLTNLFPNTQFIVTTHSPLIVQAAAARDANLVVLRREGDHVVIDQSIEAVRGWRADQILTSDLFDLPSARPKETEELLEQRKQILSKAKLTKADEKKLKEISEKLVSLPVMENPEDDKAMDIIRRAAAHLQQEKR